MHGIGSIKMAAAPSGIGKMASGAMKFGVGKMAGGEALKAILFFCSFAKHNFLK